MTIRSWAGALWVPLLAFALSGCIQAPLDGADDDGTPRTAQPDHTPTGDVFDGQVFLLAYTLEDLSGGTRMAPHGEHCAPVRKESDRLVAEEHQYDKIVGAAAALYVDPEFKGDWANFGHGAYLLAVPGKVSSQDVEETILQFEWIDGQLVIDGEPVAAPKGWTKTAEDGSWRITAELRDGPERFEVIDDGMCM